MGQVTSICPVDSLVLLGQALVAEISGSPQGQLREKNPSCSDHRRTTTEHATYAVELHSRDTADGRAASLLDILVHELAA